MQRMGLGGLRNRFRPRVPGSNGYGDPNAMQLNGGQDAGSPLGDMTGPGAMPMMRGPMARRARAFSGSNGPSAMAGPFAPKPSMGNRPMAPQGGVRQRLRGFRARPMRGRRMPPMGGGY